MSEERDWSDLGLSAPPAATESAHNCNNGWLPDEDGRAIPCLRCKSHLHPEKLPDGRATWKVTQCD